jgi:hypothetical protein
MNWKKTLVLLWPVAALLLSAIGVFYLMRFPFSIEGASRIARYYLREYTEYWPFAVVYLAAFAWSCAAWRRSRGFISFFINFFMVLVSAFLLGPLGIYIEGVLMAFHGR